MTPIKAPGDLFGHPRGLSVLSATETWERFSYFGNSALVVLYMVQHLLQPGRIEGVIGFAALRSVLEAMFGPLEPQPSPRSCSASTWFAATLPATSSQAGPPASGARPRRRGSS